MERERSGWAITEENHMYSVAICDDVIDVSFPTKFQCYFVVGGLVAVLICFDWQIPSFIQYI